MADMLKFKKGLWENLPESTVAGTVYVTTDEKAMYVDIATGNNTEGRIRIGDIIRVGTFNELQPPFSDSAFYYVESENALLKRVPDYDESGNVIAGTHKWKQINSTEAIQQSIVGLQQFVNTNADAIEAISGIVGKEADGDVAATGLVKKVADNAAAIADNAAAIATNAQDIKDIQDAIGSGAGTGSLSGRITTLEDEMDAAQLSINSHGDKITALETASAKHAEKSYVDETFATKANTYTKAEVYTKTEVDAAIDADVLVEKQRAELAEEGLSTRINTAQQKAEDAHTLASQKATISDVQALGYITTTDAEQAIEDAIAAEVTRADSKYATKAELTGTEGRVTAAQNRADAAYSLAEGKTTMAEVEGKNYANKTEAQEMATAAKNAAIADAVTKYATIAQNEAAVAAAATADDKAVQAGKDAAAADAKAVQAGKDAAAAQATANDGVSKANAAQADATQALTNAATAQSTAEAAQSAADAAQGAADAAQGTANNAVTAAGTAQSTADTALANAATADGKAAAAQKKADDAYTLADTANKAAAAAQSTANKNAENIEAIQENYATKTELSTEAGKLDAKIDAEIQAVNAMTYKGTVDGINDLLPTTGVKIGDTYVASVKFQLNGKDVLPGDLLIATDEDNTEVDGVITGEVEWHQVKTGYAEALDPALDVANNTIKLSSLGGDNGNLGTVEFVAEGAASVRTDANKIYVGTVWEDF